MSENQLPLKYLLKGLDFLERDRGYFLSILKAGNDHTEETEEFIENFDPNEILKFIPQFRAKVLKEGVVKENFWPVERLIYEYAATQGYLYWFIDEPGGHDNGVREEPKGEQSFEEFMGQTTDLLISMGIRSNPVRQRTSFEILRDIVQNLRKEIEQNLFSPVCETVRAGVPVDFREEAIKEIEFVERTINRILHYLETGDSTGVFEAYQMGKKFERLQTRLRSLYLNRGIKGAKSASIGGKAKAQSSISRHEEIIQELDRVRKSTDLSKKSCYAIAGRKFGIKSDAVRYHEKKERLSKKSG